MWGVILKFLGGDIAGRIADAYKAKLAAKNDSERLVADLAIKTLEDQQAARANAKEVRLATAGFWEMRLVTGIVAGSFALHLLLVTIDTCFDMAWSVAAYPAPFDQWEGTILLSFFGLSAASQGISSIAMAIRGRK